MSESPNPTAATENLSVEQRVDAACVRFEAAWQADQRPRIEDFLNAVPEAERPALLRELLHLELEYRRRGSEDVRADEYRTRFPQHAALIEQVCNATAPPRPGAGLPATVVVEGPAVVEGASVPPDVAPLCADQRRRWERGEGVPVEAYLRKVPRLQNSVGAVLTLAWQEVLLRREGGASPAPEEFVRRFPAYEAQIRQLFALASEQPRLALAELVQRALAGHAQGGETTDDPGRTTGPEPLDEAARTAPSAATARPKVPGYEILGVLGKGGMGVVYRARQLGLGRQVALKMILHAGHADPDERQRFHAEAEAVARLQHANIVQIYAIGEHQGLPYFALEFCPGGSLDKRLDGTPWEPRRAAQLVETLARAVQAAHQAQIIHRDLKPANVLLTADGRLKVTDFGLAKRLDEKSKTQRGAIMGTPSYMAPEQAEGKGKMEIGPATDVYALGSILYELLTGRPPFKAATPLDTVLQVVSQEPVAVRRLQPKVPRDLETVCHKCLHKDPRRRYASALALAEDLRRFRVGEPVVARSVGMVERAVRWARRRPAAAALLVLVALAAAGGAVGVPLLVARLQAAEAAQAEALAAYAEADRERNAREQEETARKQGEIARQEERAGRERQTQRAQYAEWLRQGQEALGRNDVGEARRLFTLVRDRVTEQDSADADLARYRKDAIRLLEELGHRDKARESFQALAAGRDEALFWLFRGIITGTDADSPESAAERVRAALAPYGLPGDKLAETALVGLNATEQKELREGLYELCLILAEALARLPGTREQRLENRAEALAVVDAAAVLAPDGRVSPRHRARYLPRPWAPAAQGEMEHPDTALGPLFDGCAAFESGNLAAALDHFNLAVRARPDLFWAHWFRAAVCQLQQRKAEAQANLTVCAVLRPRFAWTFLRRGWLCVQTGDFEAALADFTQAERLLAADDRSGWYVLHAHRGYLALAQSKPAQAIEELTQAVDLRPDLLDAYSDLAEAQVQSKDLDKAIENIDTAIRLKPGIANLYRTRARLQAQRGLLQPALRDLDDAIRLTPAPGKPGGPAAELLKRTLARDHRERAVLLYRLERYPDALAACRAALACDNTDAASHRLSGDVLMKLKRPAEALQAFDRVPRPQRDPDYYASRARARAALDDFPGAVSEYTILLEVRPNAEGFAQRAGAYLDAGAPLLALHDFLEAMQRGSPRGEDFARSTETALLKGPASWELSYHAARVFAQVAGHTRKPASRAHHEDRAVACLLAATLQLPALDQSAFWSQKVWPEKDKSFAPLRSNQAFAALIDQYVDLRKGKRKKP
jgi:tetratricopeptide (TPR) repeat protein/predicted Ser/Thr protein kinase